MMRGTHAEQATANYAASRERMAAAMEKYRRSSPEERRAMARANVSSGQAELAATVARLGKLTGEGGKLTEDFYLFLEENAGLFELVATRLRELHEKRGSKGESARELDALRVQVSGAAESLTYAYREVSGGKVSP